MALVLKDRVKETTTSTGTGAVTLAGASGAFQPFSVIGNGNTTYYGIVGQTSTEWEVGIGTYTLSGTTLSRDTVLSSSNSNTLVNFSAGTKDVFCTYPSEKAIYEEPNGETLINSGPITVIGAGVTSIPSLPAELGKFIGDVNSFAQIYTLNQNDGATASADFVAYNDLTTDGFTYFTDMGINSSNYTSVDYPIFTPNSGYSFHDGDNYYVGAATANKDVVIFAGGVDVTDTVATFSGTDRSVSFEAAVNVGGALDVTGAAEFGSTVLLNADPTLALQAATKAYVDNAVSAGLNIHEPVRLETGSNLNATYNNGTAGVGATLTNAGTQVALSIDGVATVVNDRILVRGQTTATQNGVYVVTNIGSGSTNWVLTRAADADSYGANSTTQLGEGSYFFVTNGLTGTGDSYVVTTVGTITFGTTNITFSQFSGAITYVGGTNIDVTGQTISLTGTVAATNGGTGTNTVATGDLLYGSATNTWSKLGIGAAYKSLVVNASGTQVEWNAVPLDQSAAISGALGPVNGGTGQSAYTLGDTLFSSATNTLAKLAGNTTTTKQFLSQTGTGSASAAPSWATIDAGDIGSGTLGATRGGTGFASYTVGDLLYANTTTSLARLADVAVGNALISGGVGADPFYGKIGLTTHVSGTLGVANGGTGVTSSTGSGNVVLSTSPTLVTPILGTPQSGNFSTGTFTWPTFNQNTTGTAGNVTGVVAIANGGTGESTRQAAMDALAGATTSGQYLRGNGTDVVMSAIQAGDVPTLNQNTTGNAGTATTLQTARNINGVSFNGSADITVTATTTNALTLGTGLTGTSFNGSGAITAAVSYGTTAGTACQGNDARLSDSRQATNTNTQLASLGVGTAASGTAGEIRATNNITAFFSDDRLKTRHGKIENALDKLQTLDGFYYTPNQVAQDLGYAPTQDIGVSAQAVQAILPEVVAPAPIDDKYLTVRYEKLVPLLIEAIKELKAEVDALKGK
jgi:hypothetical protein